MAVNWRAEPFKRSTYYLITTELSVTKTTDKNRDIDIRRWKLGNYFQTKEQAAEAAEYLKIILKLYQGKSIQATPPIKGKE